MFSAANNETATRDREAVNRGQTHTNVSCQLSDSSLITSLLTYSQSSLFLRIYSTYLPKQQPLPNNLQPHVVAFKCSCPLCFQRSNHSLLLLSTWQKFPQTISCWHCRTIIPQERINTRNAVSCRSLSDSVIL